MVEDSTDFDAILSAAVELESPEERAAFVRNQCGGDEALRLRIQRLVDAHFRAGGFLESPAIASAHTAVFRAVSEAPGTIIGGYKLLQQIGEGGMGVVFMAEQTEPIQRTVALKIIKPGMDTRQVIARFEAERQALAVMDHPNIAKVLDAGTTVDLSLREREIGSRSEPTTLGRPYFVMELVKGVPITKYCDEKQLSLRERLDLFMPVCQAVQHAHQKGIIHRDIKPTNVLVAEYDNRAVPKVIDFGVAKATAQKLTERTMFTEFGQVIGTVEYMSPEQAKFNQLDIDTRSDIYSLGVLLYELLTSSTPFERERLREAAFDEVLRIIREEEPPQPSTRLSSLSLTERVGATVASSLASVAANRHTEPARLCKDVRGELDWIVMRSLEKDRQRRYQTASALADDLHRYLTDQPVDACPPSVAYRLKKFIRRNKGAVLAGSAVAAALIAGLIVASIGFIQARHQAGIARAEATRADHEAEVARTQAVRSEQVTKFLTDMLEGAGPAVARGRDATLLREILSTTAQRVEKELTDQPEVQGDLWYTLGETYSQIQDQQQAMTMLKRAVESYRAAFDKPHAKLGLALCQLGGEQSISGDIVSGNSNAELGLAIAREAKDPIILAECLSHRILAFEPHGSRPPSEAIPLLREAISLWKQDGKHPNDMATCMVWLAITLRDTAEAESLGREALALARQSLPEGHPDIYAEMNNLSGILLRRGKFEEAETIIREALEQNEKLYGEQTRPLGINRRRLVAALAQGGKWDEAEAVVRKGLEVETRSPDPHWHAYAIMWVRLKAARGQLDEALQESERFISAYPQDVGLKWDRVVLLLQTGRFDEYRRLCHALLQEKGYLPNEIAAARLALLLPVDGADFERACDLADSAVASEKLANFGIGVVNSARLTKAFADYRRQRLQSAPEWASRALASDRLEKHQQSEAYIIQAMTLAARKQPESARAALARADSLLHEPHAIISYSHSEGGILEWALVEFIRREAVDVMAGRPPITRPEGQSYDPSVAELREHGNVRAAAERWKEAVADFSRAVELDPSDTNTSMRLAVAHLKNGSVEEYRRHCRAFLDRTTNNRTFPKADQAAKSALLLPVEGADFERACDLADYAATATEPNRLLPWMALGKALAEYRRARYESANEWAKRCIAADQVPPECAAAARFIQAAACARLEQMEEARAALASGDELAKRPRAKVELTWLDWAIADILRGEADRLIAGNSAPQP